MKSILKFLLPFIILTNLNLSLLAQVSGKLTGIVKDNNGEPLVGANVIIEGTNLGAATDLEGRYIILNIRAGTYTVKFSYIGYKSQRVQGVRISADRTKVLDAVLEPEVIHGKDVIIVAKKPIIETSQTSSVSIVDKDDIKKLPVQSLNEIVNLQAGVIDGHFRGGRLGEVQYQVDGVSVVNPYNNSSILEIDRSMIEEVQVISGTFDAKYGQAMSGVVNVVLKTGADKLEVSGETYWGDYFTKDTKRYPHNNSFSPTGIQNYQLSINGPTGLPQTTFFLNSRRYLSEGWMFGERRFNPTDKNDFEKRIFLPSGNNEIVPMNYSYEWNGQLKLTNQSLKNFQFSYEAIFNLSERKYYNHGFRLNPDGTPINYTTSISHGLTFTHTISPLMFYKLNIRQNYFKYESYVYEDLFDPKYLDAGQPKGDANYKDGAIVQGVDLGRFRQKTNSGVIKGDFTWQINNFNLIELGIEGQYSEITFGPPGFFVTTNINGVEVLKPVYQFPRIPGLRSYYPKQIASYLQDRIELGDLVIRAGLRFEYFDAAAKVPSDLHNPANTITGAPESKLVDTKVKTALSPRLALSFPLTASASVYFSYGHFYQLPGLNLLYDNSDYSLLDQLQAGGISYGVMGNPDLKPEMTIQYEFGLKQAFAEFLGVQLSFFYKDIRDLLGVEFVDTYTAASYARFTNVDFGSVYGITLSIFQRDLANFNTSLDYTLQFARGNSSDPRETANRAASGMDPRPRDLPFNWDQRHTLNLSVIYSVPDDYSLSAILKFGSGQPYTPEIGSGFGALQETNSGRKEAYFLVDLRAEKYFDVGFVNFSLFARIINALNTHFVNGFVFNSTGSPDYTLTPSANPAALYDPSRFYEPRKIELGISFRSK